MKQLHILVIFTVILGSWNLDASAQNVNFPDANLAAAVRSALDLAEGADIPQTSLAGLTSLQAFRAEIADLTGLEQATGLTFLYLTTNSISDISPLQGLTALTYLDLGKNNISDISPLAGLTALPSLNLRTNPISDLSPLARLINLTSINLIDINISDSELARLSPLTALTRLYLSANEIRDLTPLVTAVSGMSNLSILHLNGNQIRDITPLGSLTHLTKLTNVYLNENQIKDITPLSTLTGLTVLRLDKNPIRDLSPLSTLTGLQLLYIHHSCYTNIQPLAPLTSLTGISIDETFEDETMALPILPRFRIFEIPLQGDLCALPSTAETETETETAPREPEPAVKRRRNIVRCGLGWSPHSQYQHHGELPKVMIYALEFEYDPEGHGRYICNTIEIRTGDDSIENLAGWNLYLGTLYNPSRIPLKIPEEHSQITGRILRITPEMLGLETFPCNTVNGISHPLPGVQYVLKTDENILIDTAYSCFVWGQNAYTTVNGKNVKSKRRISSAVLRQMETPRLERYILDNIGVYITYMNIEAFTWDRAVLSDWLLGSSEETVVANPNAPFLSDKKLTTTWGAIKKHPILRQRNFKHKPAR